MILNQGGFKIIDTGDPFAPGKYVYQLKKEQTQ
jgi:hypothetical protein